MGVETTTDVNDPMSWFTATGKEEITNTGIRGKINEVQCLEGHS